MEIIKLSELKIEFFQKYDPWQVLEESYEDDELLLSPAEKNIDGLISKRNGEVWCLNKSVFFDGEVPLGSTMCRGDSCEGPLLWSVWKGNKIINLSVPPAHDFVLEIEGPMAFCRNSISNQLRYSQLNLKFCLYLNFSLQGGVY